MTEPICGVRKGASKTQSNVDQKLQSIAQSSDVFEVTYADIYGPNANPQLIPIVEAEQLRRLPAELRDGVPRNIQRIFMYGGYENLSREAKTHVRRGQQQFKDIHPEQRVLTSEFRRSDGAGRRLARPRDALRGMGEKIDRKGRMRRHVPGVHRTKGQ